MIATKPSTTFRPTLKSCLKILPFIFVVCIISFSTITSEIGNYAKTNELDDIFSKRDFIFKEDKDLNFFLGSLKYNEIIERYQNNKNKTFNTYNNIDTEWDTIYWIVTEDGFSYCSWNCLETRNKSSFQYISDKHLTKNNQVDYKKQLKKFFKSDLFGNAYNHTFKLIEALNSNFDWKYPIMKTRLSRPKDNPEVVIAKSGQLKCVPYINETQYDYLKGIKHRRWLKGVPEPEILTIFDRTGKIKMRTLKAKLVRMKKEELNEVKLYNRIGNYYRITGNALQSIECFRKALYLEPFNSDVLINLARVFLKIQYYEDAIFLTRKSLEYIRSNRLPLLQHFTMAEILKINGYLDEAELHIQYALKLKPTYSNGLKLLKEINQLQLILQKKQEESSSRNLNENAPYLFYLTSNIYVRMTTNVIMALLFLLAAILCGLVGVIFDDHEEKCTDETTATKNAKLSKLNKDLKNFTLSDFGSGAKKSQKIRK